MRKEKWKKERWVKGRNEAGVCKVVVEIVAKVQGREVAEVAEAAWRNSQALFGLDEGIVGWEVDEGVVEGAGEGSAREEVKN